MLLPIFIAECAFVIYYPPANVGAQPRPKKDHKPSSDGCGVTMLQVQTHLYSLLFQVSLTPSGSNLERK